MRYKLPSLKVYVVLLAPCLYDEGLRKLTVKKIDCMKKLFLIATLLTTLSFSIQAQDAGSTQKRKQQGEQQTPQRDTNLIGNDNESDNEEANEDDRANYRNNEVSGNPNNRTVGDGSDRESESGVNTNESSESVPAVGDESNHSHSNRSSSNQNQGNSSSQSNSNNATSVIEHTSSGSGSPAVPAGNNGRDGTNTVQKAGKNMEGARSTGVRTGNKNVDQNEEIRKGTLQQQDNKPANNNTSEQADSNANAGTQPKMKTREAGAKPKTPDQSDQKQVAGPSSGSENNNSNVKQSIDSKAENTNGREVSDDNKPTQVKAMDTESKITSDDPKNKKLKKHKRRRHKH
jgi:hypothetical protein